MIWTLYPSFGWLAMPSREMPIFGIIRQYWRLFSFATLMSDDLFLSTNHDGKWTVINMNINPSKIRNGINGGIDHKQIYLFISENKNIFQLNPTFEKKLAGNRDFLRTIAFDTNKHQQQHMQWEHHMDHYCCCYWPRSIHLIMDFIPATYADWLQKGITPSANDQMNLIVWVERANK